MEAEENDQILLFKKPHLEIMIAVTASFPPAFHPWREGSWFENHSSRMTFLNSQPPGSTHIFSIFKPVSKTQGFGASQLGQY